MKDTLVMVMAGGKGSRLGPLTVHRSKPAVPFAGRYRIVDFVLSNLVNSGYRRIYVLTQYMSSSLIKHMSRNWRLSGFGEYIEVVPAQMRVGEFWYRGTADAVYQNLNLVRDARASTVGVFGGDHIYKFAIDQMDEAHRDREADLTVAAIPVPLAEAHQFGCIDVDASGRIVGFVEKPANPPAMPGRPGFALVSMGNYMFRRDVLEQALVEDAALPASRHDFGRDIIPRLLAGGARVYAYDFFANRIPGDPEEATPYWRDVGTIDSYFTANMEVRARVPAIDLYNRRWRIRSADRDYPPARFVRAGEAFGPASVDDSLICEGTIISSARVADVVLGYDCFIHAGAELDESVILSGCDVGAGARLRRVLLDKNCKIEPGCVIGEDAEADAARFPFVTESGIVVVPKGTVVPATGPMILANDVVELLHNEPELRAQLRPDSYAIASHQRHSYESAGPRFKRYGADGALRRTELAPHADVRGPGAGDLVDEPS
ncbi:MAG: glucose-1-phosphate adenylyltransferase [Kofleriaceae bacterium]|nr:glucose-1-phosphate adenylyltransferase [Kofleriaceae bacterium]MBP6837838.1 glucose-1-phosphate adenylyltransferase [Kofleriaceae bacterium]MBP9205517.1 glucose-1-phosphate adenylyltransferase [Kofleriaceae bacterium]